jgi:hypothetical protein
MVVLDRKMAYKLLEEFMIHNNMDYVFPSEVAQELMMKVCALQLRQHHYGLAGSRKNKILRGVGKALTLGSKVANIFTPPEYKPFVAGVNSLGNRLV